MVAKGTRDCFVKVLKHEAEVYDKLRVMQGKDIPVHLGNVDLATPWHEIGFKIIHMLFVSCDGEMVRCLGDYKIEYAIIARRMSHSGVKLNDLAERNVLWNNRLMVIDFERSELKCPQSTNDLQGHRRNKQLFDIAEDEDVVEAPVFESATKT